MHLSLSPSLPLPLALFFCLAYSAHNADTFLTIRVTKIPVPVAQCADPRVIAIPFRAYNT